MFTVEQFENLIKVLFRTVFGGHSNENPQENQVWFRFRSPSETSFSSFSLCKFAPLHHITCTRNLVATSWSTTK